MRLIIDTHPDGSAVVIMVGQTKADYKVLGFLNERVDKGDRVLTRGGVRFWGPQVTELRLVEMDRPRNS